MKRVLLLAVFAGLYLCGCAMGNKHNYKDVVAKIMVKGTSSINVATLDHRSEIVAGDTDPQVTGWCRGGYGNPFEVRTESGLTLGEEMNASVAASLARRGFKTVEVITSPKDTEAQVIERLKVQKADRLVLLLIKEWFSDTYVGTDINYDLQLTVYDQAGAKLASNDIKDTANIGGGFNAPAYAKKTVPVGFKQRLEELFNEPEILKALQ